VKLLLVLQVLGSIIMVVICPFIIMIALNELFPALQIKYTLGTWCAVIALIVFTKILISFDSKE
jgi:Co/Zn/Cd efflux system component